MTKKKLRASLDQGRSTGEAEGTPLYGDGQEAYRVSGGLDRYNGAATVIRADDGKRHAPIPGGAATRASAARTVLSSSTARASTHTVLSFDVGPGYAGPSQNPLSRYVGANVPLEPPSRGGSTRLHEANRLPVMGTELLGPFGE